MTNQPLKGLLLFRHGATAKNAARVIQGHVDEPLSATGEQQSRALALRLAATPISAPISALLTSPLSRAISTAEIVARELKLSPLTHPTLVERSYGEFEGRKFPEFEQEMQLSGLGWSNFRPKGGESISDVKARIAPLLASIQRGDWGTQPAICSHGSTLVSILSCCFPEVSVEHLVTLPLSNVAVCALDYSAEGWCSLRIDEHRATGEEGVESSWVTHHNVL